jgi:hypothetical protein
MIWNGGEWRLRAFRHGPVSRWTEIKGADKRIYRKNAYRVLLTRARQGMVIYVPEGSSCDATNLPDDFDRTARFLIKCGVLPLDEVAMAEKEEVGELTSLFD